MPPHHSNRLLIYRSAFRSCAHLNTSALPTHKSAGCSGRRELHSGRKSVRAAQAHCQRNSALDSARGGYRLQAFGLARSQELAGGQQLSLRYSSRVFCAYRLRVSRLFARPRSPNILLVINIGTYILEGILSAGKEGAIIIDIEHGVTTATAATTATTARFTVAAVQESFTTNPSSTKAL